MLPEQQARLRLRRRLERVGALGALEQEIKEQVVRDAAESLEPTEDQLRLAMARFEGIRYVFQWLATDFRPLPEGGGERDAVGGGRQRFEDAGHVEPEDAEYNSIRYHQETTRTVEES